jgi:hypothetical protein
VDGDSRSEERFKLLLREFAVAQDLTEQTWSDGFTGVHRNRRDTAIGMPEAMMAAFDYARR